jgi:hypothetical protein
VVDTLPLALARWLAERGRTAERVFDIRLHTADERGSLVLAVLSATPRIRVENLYI